MHPRSFNQSRESTQLPRMAPNLPESSHEMIRDMIISKFENAEIAKAVGCGPNTVRNIRLNLYIYGSTKAPQTLADGSEALPLLC